MKIFFFIIFTISLASVLAQSDINADQSRYGRGKMPHDKSGRVIFTKIIQAEGHSKEKIHNASKMCIIEMFNTANNVIQMDDIEAGIIIVKGFSNEPSRGYMGTEQDAEIWFTIKIYSKSERYKIDVYQIKGRYSGGVVNGIYLSPSDWPAESLTYDNCFKPNGKMKTAREGFYRRAIIDCCNRLLTDIPIKINNNLSNSVENTESW